MRCDKEAQLSITPACTLELLANYLYSRCSGVRNSELSMYRRRLIETDRPLVSDVLLFIAVQIQLKECTGITDVEMRTKDTEINASSTIMDTSLLVRTLELVALEKLISVRQVMICELHSGRFPVMNEFEALYVYKCGLFEECLEMCRNHVNMLILSDCAVHQLYFAVHPEFISLLDGELSSLFGVVRILHPVWALLVRLCPGYQSISVFTLSLYLMVRCQKKLRKHLFHDSLRLIRFVHSKMIPANNETFVFDRLILKLIYRSVKLYIEGSTRNSHRSTQYRQTLSTVD